MLEEKQFSMSMLITNEARLNAKADYYYQEAKRLDAELIAEQAKCLRFCQRITELEKQVEKLSKFVPEIDW